jgi:hypothetical protein
MQPNALLIRPNFIIRKSGCYSAVEAWQVVLTKLREGLLGSPLQSVIEVVAPSRG